MMSSRAAVGAPTGVSGEPVKIGSLRRMLNRIGSRVAGNRDRDNSAAVPEVEPYPVELSDIPPAGGFFGVWDDIPHPPPPLPRIVNDRDAVDLGAGDDESDHELAIREDSRFYGPGDPDPDESEAEGLDEPDPWEEEPDEDDEASLSDEVGDLVITE